MADKLPLAWDEGYATISPNGRYLQFYIPMENITKESADITKESADIYYNSITDLQTLKKLRKYLGKIIKKREEG